MALAGIESLFAGFCDILRVRPPSLAPDSHGRIAFHAVLRGVTIEVILDPAASEEHLFVVLDMGPVAPGSVRTHDAMRELLEANFAVLEVHPPVIGLDWQTGAAALRYVYPLADASPQALFELVERGTDWVLYWRGGTSTGFGDEALPAPDSHELHNLA